MKRFFGFMSPVFVIIAYTYAIAGDMDKAILFAIFSVTLALWDDEK